MRRHWLPLTLALACVACALVVAWAPDRAPSRDETLYLAVATSVADGHAPRVPGGDPLTVRAPLYPLLLGLSIASLGDPGGPDFTRVLVATGLAAALLALALVLWGRGVAGLAVALGGVALVYTGVPFLELAATLGIDLLAAALALTALCLLEVGARRSSMRVAAAGGLALGLAILVKETALVVAPVPVLVGLVRYRSDGPGFVRPLLAAYLAAGVVLLPWWVLYGFVEGRFFLTSLSGDRAVGAAVLAVATLVALVALVLRPPPRALAGPLAWIERLLARPGAGVAAALALISAWWLVVYVNLTRAVPGGTRGGDTALGEFLEREVFSRAGSGWLAAAGLAALAVGAWRGHRGDQTALLVVVSYLPVLALIASKDWSGRQVLVALLVLQVGVARAVVGLVAAAWRGGGQKSPKSLARALPALGAAAVIGAVVTALAANGIVPARASDREKRSESAARSALEDAAAWLEDNAPEDSVILVGTDLGYRLHRATSARYRLPAFPVVRLGLPRSGPPFVPVAEGSANIDLRRVGTSWLSIRRDPNRGFYSGLTQEALIRAINSEQADFVVLPGGADAESAVAGTRVLKRVRGLTRRHNAGGARSLLVVFAVDRPRLRVARGRAVLLDQFTLSSLLADVGAVRGLGLLEAYALLDENLPPVRVIRTGERLADER